MCGIAGWQGHMPAGEHQGVLASMAQAIAHRGPDDDGTYVDAEGGVALAHRRLSIIDLSAAGHQPMASACGRVVLAFNGEVYNFQGLRAELQALGHQFRGRSDTEVVLNALAQWGAGALQRFSGMFALAAWFTQERQLLLARDPTGMKPLYLAQRPGPCLAFGSELKSLLQLPGFKAESDRQSLHQFLEFGYTFDDTRTALQGISKLQPGHALVVRNGQAGTPYPFFTVPRALPPAQRSLEATADALYQTLDTVVAEHLVADVPVGLLLSGGLDSSVVAALAARHQRVATICMAFGDSAVDERVHARTVAAHIGSDHSEEVIGHQDVVHDLEKIVWVFDDLFADWGTVSTRLLYRRCRERGIKVVLVGEGADELLGGYSAFEAAQAAKGPRAWRIFQLYRRYAGRRHGSQFSSFNRIMQGYLLQHDGHWFDAVRCFESRNQLPNNYVMKVDKASMSVSVEARAPFLDKRVADLAYSIPAQHLLGQGTNKLALRVMAERHGLLPPSITRRPKFGASIAASWMDDSPALRQYAGQVILARNSWVDELGLRPAMSDYFAGRRQGYAFPRAISIFSNLAWRLLLLNLWSRKYLTTA